MLRSTTSPLCQTFPIVHSFMKKWSTVSQFLTFWMKYHSLIETKIFTLFLDLNKAANRVCHQKRLAKLNMPALEEICPAFILCDWSNKVRANWKRIVPWSDFWSPPKIDPFTTPTYILHRWRSKLLRVLRAFLLHGWDEIFLWRSLPASKWSSELWQWHTDNKMQFSFALQNLSASVAF